MRLKRMLSLGAFEARERSSWSIGSVQRRAEKVKPQKQKEACDSGFLFLLSGEVDDLLERQRWERRAQELGMAQLVA